MKRELAEALLAKIMGWSDAEKAAERARLESFASYKYDEYQQFVPGRRFIESLALWLKQLDPGEERKIAYEFVRSRLIFISNVEMNHLVQLSFPTIIRPILLNDVAAEIGESNPCRVKKIAGTPQYRALLRRTLILGLSDGARTDQFRRANPRDVSNEQVFHAYDVSDVKAGSMVGKLKVDLATILEREVSDAEATFQNVILLDDFSASGTSAIRKDEHDEWDGKIPRIIGEIENGTGVGAAIAANGVRVIVILYIASEQAVSHIEKLLRLVPFTKGVIEFYVVNRLNPEARLDDVKDKGILDIANQNRYFDQSVDDEHGKIGKSSKRLGYAEGRLPLILSHNTPNNSLFILWAEDIQNVRGLFPRVDRHRKRQ